MIHEHESKISRIIHHLVQDSASQMGCIMLVDHYVVNANQYFLVGTPTGNEYTSALWGYLQHEPLFEEIVKNQSVYVFETKSIPSLQYIYEQGIRYGLIIPFYYQSQHVGNVFLGNSFAYPRDTVNLLEKKVQTFAEFFVELTEGNAKAEPFKNRLKRYEQSAKALFEYNPDIMWWIDINGTILSANARVEDITGFAKSYFSNQSFDQFFPSKDLDTVIRSFVMARKGKPQNFEAAFIHKEGRQVELNITFVPVTVDYKIVGVYGIGQNITERKQYITALKESNDFTTSILESITDAFLSVDKDWHITYWNKEAERLTGTKREDCLGAVFWNVFPQMVDNVSFTKLHKALYEEVTVQYEYNDQTVDKWFQVHAYPSQKGLSVYIQDITGAKKAEQRIAYMTYYDTLTGLPNQKLLMERVNRMVIRNKENHDPFAVMLINLDRFQQVNGFHGYRQGDNVLIAVSKRLMSCLREEDTLCRFEGDVFAVKFGKIGRAQTEEVAERILWEFQRPILLDQQEFVATASIGISFYPEDGKDYETLTANADSAMRSAKEKGKNNYQFYNETMNIRSSLHMISELRNALKKNELQVVYQPQVNIRTGRITGNEALLRWEHPVYGLLPPSEFIPLAEESGLIVSMGDWVLRTACAQNMAWQDRGLEPMTISINISPLQFVRDNFVEVVREILEETKLDPRYLDLEITEGMALDVNHVHSTLQDLKKLGVRISMDDFGKGYSSLYYLKRLPIDTLKIDQSFVSDCTIDESDATIVRTIISMAHHLKMNVIAEGVETRDQLVFLQQNLCDEIQGYLFSTPLPAEQLVQYLPKVRNMVMELGMDNKLSEQIWLEEQVRAARQDLEDTIRKQQGVTFKFHKHNDVFIHTLCDGELLHTLQITPDMVVGKTLHEYLPKEMADDLDVIYRRAWNGDQHVQFEYCLNDIWFHASLRPIFRGGRVVEVIGTCVDITKRKQVEEELKATKDQLESFIQNTSDAIGIIGFDKTIRQVNRAFVETFGWTEDECIGNLPPIIPEYLSSEMDTLREKVFSGEVIADYETLRKRRDGSCVDVSLTLSPIKDSVGNVIAVAGVLRDISERKRSEMALKESEERYRQLVEMSPDIILVHDHGEVLFINQAGLDFAGIKDPQTYHNDDSFDDFLSSDQCVEVAELVERLQSGQKLPPTERRILLGNNEVFYFEETSAPVDFRGKKAIQVIARDVTERKQHEEEYKKIHDQYRLIAENMSDLIAVTDGSGGFLYTSPSHEQVLGYPLRYFNRINPLELVHPDDKSMVQNEFLKSTATGMPFQIEFQYRLQSGKWIYVEAKGTPVISKEGQVNGIIIVSRDITERKLVEVRFRKSAALAAVGELAAGVAHEIRNPITSIRGFVQLMKDGHFKPDYFDVMFSEFKALEAKIDEFLLLAKPQSTQHTPINLWELLQDVFMIIESQAILNNVQIFSEPENEQLVVMGDRQQLKQVFVNLLKNAIESMPDSGEISVTMKKENASQACVTITDQGCGISQERLLRLGEPFYSSKEKGTGLGLTISYKIVKEHRGSIVFQSAVNKGTTVQVHFQILN